MQQELDTWIRSMIRWAGFVPNRDLSGWVLLVIAVLLGLAVNVIITQTIRYVNRRRLFDALTLLRVHVRWAFWIFVPSLFFLTATNLQSVRFIRRHPIADKAAEVLFLVASTWLIIRLLKYGEVLLIRQYDITQDVNLAQRKFVTQVRFVRRVLASTLPN